MEEKQMDTPEEQDKEKKKKIEEELPACTTAPDAEQARAHDDDEPCDDGRAGVTDKG